MSNDAYRAEFPPDAVWHAGVETRASFIVRTYMHLFAAIVGFTLIQIVIFTSGSAKGITETLLTLPGGWLLVLGGFMLVSWIASRVAFAAKSVASQYAALGAFIIAEAIIFVPMLYIAGTYYPGVITSAAGVTLVGFAMLTFVAFKTRRDFSFLRGLLMWGSLCALGLIVAAVIFGFTLGPVFSVAMIAFAGAAILYDTSNVLHHYPADKHVSAALQLFASVALLFWYVLRLLMSLSRD
jgi:FtsH-binding integral membrane protein